MSVGLQERALNNLKKRRQNILDGKINSIPSPFKRFSRDFVGLEQGVSMGITSFTKSGKTQITLYLLFEAFLYCFNNPNKARLKILYYNLEETDERIFNRFQSWLLFKLDKIRISPFDLRSTRNDNPVPEQILQLLESEKYKQYFEAFEKCFTFSGTPNPTGVMKECKNYAEEHGTVFKKQVDYSEVEVFDHYEQDDPFEYRIVVIDHISLLENERGMSKKETIDKMSEYLTKYLRNRYNFTTIVIQQQSTESESNDSVKLGRIKPSSANLSDSKYVARDVNSLLGLFNPFKFSLREYNGYDITRLKDHARFLEVILSRDGELGGICPLFFDGATCSFFEMPLPNEREELEKVYRYAESLDNPKPKQPVFLSLFRNFKLFKSKELK